MPPILYLRYLTTPDPLGKSAKVTASKLSSKGSAITLIEYWSGIFEYIIESILDTLIPDPESAVLELES